MEVSGQFRAAAVLPRERAPCMHWIGEWVGPIEGLDTVEGTLIP
jgi:hypothetical protein